MPDLPEDPDAAIRDENKSIELKFMVLRRAAEIVGASDPLSVTSGAARRVLDVVRRGGAPRHGIEENPDVVAELIGSLREIIRMDPDDAFRWAEALRGIRVAYGALIDPSCWKPSEEQKLRAREVLGGEVHDIRFTENGLMFARPFGAEFVEIPPLPEVPK